ncbi:unnamed protein product [Coregonus sp. 'balchen']|nr:unnamed protein product [Coregonus sp. 'balchen']
MEGKLWGFCLTTAILLFGSSCHGTPRERFPKCTFEVRKDGNSHIITLRKDDIGKQALNLWFPLRNNITSKPSQFYRNAIGDQATLVKPETICGEDLPYDAHACRDKTTDTFILTITMGATIAQSCVTCDKHVGKPDINISVSGSQLESELMGNTSTAAISMGKVKGLLCRLRKGNPKEIYFGFSRNKDMTDDLKKDFNRSVRVSKEAYDMVFNQGGTFVGVLAFPSMSQSPPPKNISASDVASLTYISYIGCGLSIFFLGVAIFMQFVISKTKSSQATKILVNLNLPEPDLSDQ